MAGITKFDRRRTKKESVVVAQSAYNFWHPDKLCILRKVLLLFVLFDRSVTF